MRPSKRSKVLQAALQLAGDVGIRGLTIDAVAAEAGLTKAGVLYHFSHRDDLITAVLDHIADSWEEQVTEALGTHPDQGTATDRVIAFATAAATTPPQSAELAVLIDAMRYEHSRGRWRALVRRWTDDPDQPLSTEQRIALLAADGLWLNNTTASTDLSPEEHQATLNRIREMSAMRRPAWKHPTIQMNRGV
ncbi:TetR/AcrR family transcriptional regulator [Aeromicrobium sp. CTD01-1L150]|uniref:TetR/AcrR family transcriptional regulator n=1 Tax=Aeromicrobium sp. CTD01-1L150 TaxID=3341830 RepID=UPI0035C1B694